MQTRRRFLKDSLAAGTMALPALNCTRSKRPNVILIFPDQMRASAMGCSGNHDVLTPNLDRMAADGALLQTFSNTPVCGPARACILTGQYAHQHGIVTNDLRLRPEKITLAEVFGENGYRTGFIGKWHLDGGPKQPGYVPPERRQGFGFWAANECSHKHFDSQYFKGDSPSPVPIKQFETEIWFDEAQKFITGQAGVPFFLTIAVGPPHNPYKAPDKYEQLYSPENLTMRPNWESVGAGTRKAVAGYYAMVTAIDDRIGRLLHHLDALDLSDDTIVLFTSDHGDMLGSHGRIYKRQPWEESIKVPGILRWPGKIKPQQPAGLFTTVDMAPTLLDLCGIPVPDTMTGRSLKPMLLGESAGPDTAFFQIFGPCNWQDVPAGWRAIRTQRYLYARFAGKPWVLYDLRNDPYQTTNLVSDPQFKKLGDDLDNRLMTWMERQNDAWELNWTEPFADTFELSKYRAFYSIADYQRWRGTQKKNKEGI